MRFSAFFRKIAFISAAASCLWGFSACGSAAGVDPARRGLEKIEGEGVNEQVKYEDLTAEEWLASLDSGDYNGYAFTIATSVPARFVADEELGGMVSPALEKRNALVSGKYNVRIKETYYEESRLFSALSNAVSAGTQFSDLVSASMPTMAALAASGGIMNLFSVPFFNPGASYLNREIVENSAIYDYMYAVYDQASFYEEDLWCVFYNETLLGSENAQNLVKKVKSGAWTWDDLVGYAEEAAFEVMEKRSPDLQKDIFGIGTYAETGIFKTAFFTSAGLSLFGDTFLKKPAYTMDDAKGDAAAGRVREILKNKAFLTLSGEDASRAFLEGRTAFFIYRVGFAKAAAEASVHWSLAPLPKLDISQPGYRSYIGPTSAGLSVPARQADSARTGKVLNAILASSYLHLDEAIKTNYITFCLRDNDAAIMLSMVLENPAIDVGTVYSGGFDRLSFLTVETLEKAVSSDLPFGYLFRTNDSVLAQLNETDFR